MAYNPVYSTRPDLSREELEKLLYKAALFCIHPAFWKDSEAVKAKRDQRCHDLYSQPHEQLTDQEVWNVIIELQQESGYQKRPKAQLASDAMLKKLRYSAIYCALRYCPLTGLSSMNKETGEILEGEELREFLKSEFAKKKSKIDAPVFTHLFNKWINRKANDFLVQGGYKQSVKNPDNLYFMQLDVFEAQYLIDRFREIHKNLEMNEVDKNNVPLNKIFN